MLELASPVGVARALVAVRDRRVDDDECRARRHRDGRCSSVPQSSRIASPSRPSTRRGLVEDPARHADGAQLGALAGAARARAARPRTRRPRRARARPTPRAPPTTRARRRSGRSESHRPRQPDRRPAEQIELGGDRLRVARPAGRPQAPPPSAANGGAAPKPLRRRARSRPGRRATSTRDAVLDRDRQDEPAAVVGVLADQVDAAGRPRDARRRSRAHRDQRTPSRSTTKTSVSPGPIAPPAPRSP